MGPADMCLEFYNWLTSDNYLNFLIAKNGVLADHYAEEFFPLQKS
jgi:hypothetical protein